MQNRFASEIDQVLTNAAAIHAMASGNAEERAFHETRTKNALYHIVLDTPEGAIYAPIKWCAAPANTLASYPVNKDPNTQKFRAAITRLGFVQVTPGDPRHDQLYAGFVAYCTRYGFTHSKPGPNQRHYHILPNATPPVYPDDLADEDQEFWEGNAKTVSVNRYERDPAARKACVEMKGSSCSVCNFDFGNTFGELGVGFIHVHHVVPISEVGSNYKVDPATDLEPVCPNCHAMLHRSHPPLTIEELRQKILS